MPVHVAEGRALYRLQSGSLLRIDAGAPVTPPPTGDWADAFAAGAGTLIPWFEANTGPEAAGYTVNPTVITGTQTVTSQAQADALAGRIVDGRIDSNPGSGGTITLRGVRTINPGASTGRFRAIRRVSGSLIVEDCDIDGGGSLDEGIFSFTAVRRTRIRHCFDGAKGTGGVFERNFVQSLGGPGAHADGIQISSGSNITIRENCFDLPSFIDGVDQKTNACVFVKAESGNEITNVQVSDNYLDGGNYVVYFDSDAAAVGPPTGCSLTGNRFGRSYKEGLLYLTSGADVTRVGNIWDDDETSAIADTGEPDPPDEPEPEPEASYLESVLADTPLLYLPLDETAGTSFADASGNSRDATLSGAGVTLGADPLVLDGGHSVQFGGTAAATRPYDAALATSQWHATVYCSHSTVATLARPLSNMDAGEDRGWEFFYNDGNGEFELQVGTGTASVNLKVAVPADGRVVRLDGSYDGTTARLYLDGTEVGSVVTTYDPPDTSGLSIGKRSYDANRYWQGRVDAVAVYDHALTAARVSAQYEIGLVEPIPDEPPPPPAPTFIGTSSGENGTGASETVDWPTGHTTGDLAILVGETTGDGTTHTPGGFEHLTGSPVIDVPDATGSKLHVLYRFATNPGMGPAQTGNGVDHQTWKMFAFRGVDPDTPFDVILPGTKITPSTTVTLPSITTTGPNEMVVMVVGRPDDSGGTDHFGLPVNPALTGITRASETSTTSGNGGGHYLGFGVKETAGAVGESTLTKATSTTDTYMVLALRPAPVAAGQDPSSPTAFAHGATGAEDYAGLRTQTVSPSNAGDSNTADIAAINSAISTVSAAGGGTVQLDPGTYYLNGSRVQMRSNVLLQGHRTPGSDPTVVLKLGPDGLSGLEWGGASVITSYDFGQTNMTVKDVLCDQSGDTLDGNSFETGSTGRLYAYLCEFREATNVVFDGVHTRNPFSYNIVIAACTTFGVRNCYVESTSVGAYDQIDGIHVFDSVQGDVVDNTVRNGLGGTSGDGDDGLVCRGFFAECHDVNYRNNDVLGGQHGHCMQFAGGDHNITDIIVTGNTFRGASAPRGIRFGYYGGATSTLDTVLIDGNHFEDCTSYCVDLTDGPHTNITVTDNTSVNSGPYNVDAGGGNVVSNNT